MRLTSFVKVDGIIGLQLAQSDIARLYVNFVSFNSLRANCKFRQNLWSNMIIKVQDLLHFFLLFLLSLVHYCCAVLWLFLPALMVCFDPHRKMRHSLYLVTGRMRNPNHGPSSYSPKFCIIIKKGSLKLFLSCCPVPKISCFPQSLWLKFHSRIQAVDKPTIKPSERPTDSRNLMQRPRAVCFFVQTRRKLWNP